ncbi:hypothetical protein L5C66_29485 [Pseudomonas aeruginosa]|uniref:hypothetical protein n=1 Tax=Pseudomonas aeruginosa TaxID=287 RepID=UPI001F3205B3|nr:hypothetical protein [Pseudomonas aeruginosa]MDG3714538.1 hypothetical protein [Pseudomonas aeruginosa]
MYRLLLPVTGLLAIGACHAAPASSQSLSAAQVTAIAQRIEQRYAQHRGSIAMHEDAQVQLEYLYPPNRQSSPIDAEDMSPVTAPK